MNKHIRQQLAEVERLGGSWSMTADGHAKVFDRAGVFVLKVRTSGKQVADGKGAIGRTVWRKVMRQIEES